MTLLSHFLRRSADVRQYGELDAVMIKPGDFAHPHSRMRVQRGVVIAPDEEDALSPGQTCPKGREHLSRHPSPALGLLDAN